MKRLPILNERFGRLSLIKDLGIVDSIRTVLVQCDCGTPKILRYNNLTSGKTNSCGCLYKKHGACNTAEYRAWQGMIQRCTNPTNKNYYNYGGRGIQVCLEWRKADRFLTDMGTCPFKHELDRLDPDGNYCKDNCEWSDRSDAHRHRRITHIVNGKPTFLYEVAAMFGLSCNVIASMMSRRNMTLDEVIKYNTDKYSKS